MNATFDKVEKEWKAVEVENTAADCEVDGSIPSIFAAFFPAIGRSQTLHSFPFPTDPYHLAVRQRHQRLLFYSPLWSAANSGSTGKRRRGDGMSHHIAPPGADPGAPQPQNNQCRIGHLSRIQKNDLTRVPEEAGVLGENRARSVFIVLDTQQSVS
jgi:hypothetical protein